MRRAVPLLILVAAALLLTAQSPSPTPTINGAIGSNPSARDGAQKVTPSQPATTTAINETQRTAEAKTPPQQSPSAPPPQGTQATPAEGLQIALTNYTFWLVVVGFLQFGGILMQAIFLFFTLKATEKTANAAEHALKLGQRPYLIVVIEKVTPGFQMIGPDSVSTRITVDYAFSNVGQTPAFMIDLDHVICFTPSAIPPSEPPYTDNPEWKPARGTVGPAREHHTSAWERTSREQFHKVLVRDMFAHFFTHVVYTDGLGEARYHTYRSGLVVVDGNSAAHMEFPATHSYGQDT
jgi:hypothetical protein